MTTEQTEGFEAERPRLLRLATRVLGDASGAEDVVQQAWLRLHGTDATIDSLPAWLTTVTVRLCLDRLRQRTPMLTDEVELVGTAPDPGPHGSTAAKRGWPSTSPSSTAW